MNKHEIQLLKRILNQLADAQPTMPLSKDALDLKILINKYEKELRQFNKRVENEEEEYDDSLFFDTL